MDSSSEMQTLRGRDKKFVKLRGLPWSCKPENIIDFFGSLKDEIAPHGVHMVLNAVVGDAVLCVYRRMYMYYTTKTYRRSGFNCEYLLIANCEFFYIS